VRVCTPTLDFKHQPETCCCDLTRILFCTEACLSTRAIGCMVRSTVHSHTTWHE
jgi:hypothetical protein